MWKFLQLEDTTAKWVRMLRYSSHQSVQSYDFFQQKWADAAFSTETTNVFLRGVEGWGGVYLVRKRWQEEPKWQQVLGTMLKAAQLQSLNSHLSPKNVFLWVRYMTNVVRETFLKTATLSVLIWPCSREMKTSNCNFKMPPFCLNSVTMEILLVLFLITRKFIAGWKHGHSFCRCV